MITNITSLTEKDVNPIKIYPNPAADKLYIELSSNYNISNTKCIISDVYGNICLEIPLFSYKNEVIDYKDLAVS